MDLTLNYLFSPTFSTQDHRSQSRSFLTISNFSNHRNFKSFSNRLRNLSRLSLIKCCSVVKHGLKARPTVNPVPAVETPKAIDEGGRFTKSICKQIEWLVLHKRYKEAIELFEILQARGCAVSGAGMYELLVLACVNLRSADVAKLVYRHMVDTHFELDQYMNNRVLLMFVKCGLRDHARSLLDRMPQKNVASWTTMMSGFVDAGQYEEAIEIFLEMSRDVTDADAHMFVAIIRASAGIGLLQTGTQLHSCALKLGLYGQEFVSCALIDMYSKCGCIEDALCVFEEMPEKTVVGWNSIIDGYTLNGYSDDALEMYYEMYRSAIKMDKFTYSIVLKVCMRLGSMDHAQQVHACIVRNGFELDTVTNTALLDFYCKWGSMEDARRVFDRMPCKNIQSWNAMIGGYGSHGKGKEAVKLFERIGKVGLVPNHVTYLAVLKACSSCGLFDEGRQFFELMVGDAKMKPRAMHYSCMIELLGREGLLDEAFSLIKSSPIPPTTNMWAALLTACRINKNIELGKLAAERLYRMEPEKLCNYVTLLNIYNSTGRSQDATRVLDTLNKRGLRMLPACSWIQVKKQSYKFVFGDRGHAQGIHIYRKLDELMKEARSRGYDHGEKSLLPDIGEEDQQILNYHSEKLAVAFGLIRTPEFTPLQVVQGHRMCDDCHNVVRFISNITRREIVVRDASRFHYFKGGTCSCQNYW